ncbi:MAG: D-glycerate dehydrogenase [Vicinamibacterales bacterium]
MKVLLTRRLPAAVIATLDGVAEVVQLDGDTSHEALVAAVRDVDALVPTVTDRVDRSVIEAGASLRLIANVGVGYNNIDVTAARERGIVVTNTPDVLSRATADLTWALILGITRRIGEGERMVRRREWPGWAFDQLLGMELNGKTLGIVGFGRIGREVAARAPAFGMRVVHTGRDADAIPLDRLLSTSDVVSLHVPLSDATRHLIDQPALARMKRSAYLINTARGPVVDEAALAWALKSRLLAGAALDVYEQEPQIHPDLFAFENVILAPHLGSATTETRTAMADLAVRNVVAVLSGKAPLTPVP